MTWWCRPIIKNISEIISGRWNNYKFLFLDMYTGTSFSLVMDSKYTLYLIKYSTKIFDNLFQQFTAKMFENLFQEFATLFREKVVINFLCFIFHKACAHQTSILFWSSQIKHNLWCLPVRRIASTFLLKTLGGLILYLTILVILPFTESEMGWAVETVFHGRQKIVKSYFANVVAAGDITMQGANPLAAMISS